jgi:lipoprotein signal peptidase
MTGSTHDAARARRAGRSWKSWTIFLALIALLTSADLVTKGLAFEHVAPTPVTLDRADVVYMLRTDPRLLQSLVPPHEPVIVVPYGLEFKLVLNPGAVFGTGPGMRWFFVGFTIVALTIATTLFATATTTRDWLTHTGIALIVSGGVSNLYDRLVFACVRDFIHPLPGVMIPGTSRELWPYVSNVADAFLLVGIGIVMVKLWRAERTDTPEGTGADAAPDQTGSGAS